MEPKTFFLIIALCAVVLIAALCAVSYSIYKIFSIGARSETEAPYLIIHKQHYVRKEKKDE